MLMESQLMFRTPQDISGASEQNGVAAEGDGDLFK